MKIVYLAHPISGLKVVEELEKAHPPLKLSIPEIKEKIEEYRKKIKELK